MGVIVGILWLLFLIMSALAFFALIVLSIVIYIKKYNEKKEPSQSHTFDWSAKDIDTSNIQNEKK